MNIKLEICLRIKKIRCIKKALRMGYPFLNVKLVKLIISDFQNLWNIVQKVISTRVESPIVF